MQFHVRFDTTSPAEKTRAALVNVELWMIQSLEQVPTRVILHVQVDYCHQVPTANFEQTPLDESLVNCNIKGWRCSPHL